MSPPLVSVIIPALNAEEWIASSLMSVVGQTYPKDRLEVIVVDDGSLDGTAAEAGRVLATSGIAHAVVRHQSSHGPSAARNRGWQQSRGEWIQFLDADDLLEPSKIEVQVRTAAEAELEVAAVFSPWGRLVLEGNRWIADTPWVEPSLGSDQLADVLRDDNFMQVGSLLFSRIWLRRTGGFVEFYRLVEDVELLVRIIMCDGVLRPAPSSQPLSWYRQRATSLSRESRKGIIDGCLRNARLAERYWSDRGGLTASRASRLVDVYFMGARHYAEYDPDVFRLLVRDIFRLEPAFVPRGPATLRLLARILGYPRAERCSVRYRSLKRSFNR